MSAVQSSSTIAGFQVLPQDSVNHRPTMALLSCSFDMMNSFARLLLLDRVRGWRHGRKPWNEWRRDEITRPGNLPALRFLLSKPTAWTPRLTSDSRFGQHETECPLSSRNAIVGSRWRGRPRERT